MTSPRPTRNSLSATAVVVAALLLGGCGTPTEVRPVSEKSAAAATEAPAPSAATPAVALPAKVQSDYQMAVNAYKGGNSKIAESIFLAMTKAYPDLPGPHANLGMIYVDKKQYDQAEAELNRALKLKPDLPGVYNLLGILQRDKGEFEKALQSYQEGLKLAPDNPDLLVNLGILYDLYLNQPQEALKLWQHYKTVVADDKQVDIWIADITHRTTAK